jgi:hypothetical protein
VGLFSVKSDLPKFEQDIIRSDRALTSEVKLADRAAARRTARKMRSRAPKKSGYLASTIRASKGVVGIGAIYAGVINWGWPERNIEGQEFIYSTIKESSRDWEKDYDQHLGKALSFVAHGRR